MLHNHFIEAPSPVGYSDFDGYVWVRSTTGELCGPYEDRNDAQTDFPDESIYFES